MINADLFTNCFGSDQQPRSFGASPVYYLPRSQALQAQQEPDIVAAVNQARTAAGMGPLAISSLLQVAAQRQSNDMAAHDVLSHTGSDGSTVDTSANDVGYYWTTIGENILQRNDMNAAEAYDQWWNSPPPQGQYMMDPAFTDIAVAFACTAASGNYYYMMDLGASSDPSTPVPTATAPATTTAPATAAPTKKPGIHGDKTPDPGRADKTPYPIKCDTSCHRSRATNIMANASAINTTRATGTVPRTPVLPIHVKSTMARVT